MIRFTTLTKLPKISGPIYLTIGNFDGVHLGHQALLSHLKKKGGTSVVLTFSNHPSTLFNPQNPLKPLCSLEERLSRIENVGIDIALIIPFTRELSELSYREFMEMIQRALPFTSLVLGEGAAFGKNREGTPARLKELGIAVEYVPKFLFQGAPLSSSRIRHSLLQGNFEEAAASLGIKDIGIGIKSL